MRKVYYVIKNFFQFPYIKIFKNILNKNFNIKFLTVLELEKLELSQKVLELDLKVLKLEKTRTIFKGFYLKDIII